MSKLEAVLAILDLKVDEKFRFKFGSECAPLVYKIDEEGRIWHNSSSGKTWERSAVSLTQLITQYADNICTMRTPEERREALGLKHLQRFEWGERFLKVGSNNQVYEYKSEENYWLASKVTIEDLEAKADKIIPYPYHPQKGKIVCFLDGTLDNPVVRTDYFNPDKYVMKFLDKNGLLFSTEDGARWSKARYRELLSEE